VSHVGGVKVAGERIYVNGTSTVCFDRQEA